MTPYSNYSLNAYYSTMAYHPYLYNQSLYNAYLTNAYLARASLTTPTVFASRNAVNSVTSYVPGTFIPSAWAYSPLTGAVQIPGHFTPGTIVRQPVNSGQFLRLPGGQYYNPWTNSSYSAISNTFNVNGTPYVANPWSGTYTNPLLLSQYNPTTGSVSQAAYNPLSFWFGVTR
ncbi:hypothetical protein FRUB_01540 [Fimbriiglobus ruber]|uniref:Uncharacterized protein n=1 Tax=Fimbriiglobus ruber TaxID=1908690 RepID=A0A225E6T3_9BACT|nr:hypothetical protein FRUB_01540 [Fimbriiglobus ruber]